MCLMDAQETNTLQPLKEGQVTKEFKAEAPLMRSVNLTHHAEYLHAMSFGQYSAW